MHYSSSASAHQKGKQPERSSVEEVVREGKGGGAALFVGFSLVLTLSLGFKNLDLAAA